MEYWGHLVVELGFVSFVHDRGIVAGDKGEVRKWSLWIVFLGVMLRFGKAR